MKKGIWGDFKSKSHSDLSSQTTEPKTKSKKAHASADPAVTTDDNLTIFFEKQTQRRIKICNQIKAQSVDYDQNNPNFHINYFEDITKTYLAKRATLPLSQVSRLDEHVILKQIPKVSLQYIQGCFQLTELESFTSKIIWLSKFINLNNQQNILTMIFIATHQHLQNHTDPETLFRQDCVSNCISLVYAKTMADTEIKEAVNAIRKQFLKSPNWPGGLDLTNGEDLNLADTQRHCIRDAFHQAIIDMVKVLKALFENESIHKLLYIRFHCVNNCKTFSHEVAKISTWSLFMFRVVGIFYTDAILMDTSLSSRERAIFKLVCELFLKASSNSRFDVTKADTNAAFLNSIINQTIHPFFEDLTHQIDNAKPTVLLYRICEGWKPWNPKTLTIKTTNNSAM